MHMGTQLICESKGIRVTCRTYCSKGSAKSRLSEGKRRETFLQLTIQVDARKT